MDRNSLKQFRLDRRLISRCGWISGKELDLELEQLPDVSQKMTTLGEAADRVDPSTEARADVEAEAVPPSSDAPEQPMPE